MRYLKHTLNILRILLLLPIKIPLYLLGFIILPIAVNFREPFVADNQESNPAERFKWKWVDAVYGNEEDGFGDIYYRRDFPTDTYWSRLNWCMLRNPIHNIGKTLGVRNKVIIKSVISGNPDVTDDPFIKNTGLKIHEVWDEEGKYYPMYYYCKLWRQIIPFYKGDKGIRLLLGWKNFCVKEINRRYDYPVTVAFTPFKTFVEG